MSLDLEALAWLECPACHDIYLDPVEILAYVEAGYSPGYDF